MSEYDTDFYNVPIPSSDGNGGKFYIGSYPKARSVNVFKDKQIGLVVNLCRASERNKLDEAITLDAYSGRELWKGEGYEIVDKKTLPDTKALALARQIQAKLDNGVSVYLHCRGGHGRSGTIGALVWILMYKNKHGSLPTLGQVLDVLNSNHRNQRQHKKDAQVPQSVEQLRQIAAHCSWTPREVETWYSADSNEMRRDGVDCDSVPIFFYTDGRLTTGKEKKYGGNPDALSNFTIADHTDLQGKRVTTSEVSYQIQRFAYNGAPAANKTIVELIRQAVTGDQARNISLRKLPRNNQDKTLADGSTTLKDAISIARTLISDEKALPLDADAWHGTAPDDPDAPKLACMMRALTARYKTHEPSRELLLATGNRPLIEFSKRDRCFAQNVDQDGQNFLGRQLCATRKRLREENEAQQSDQGCHRACNVR